MSETTTFSMSTTAADRIRTPMGTNAAFPADPTIEMPRRRTVRDGSFGLTGMLIKIAALAARPLSLTTSRPPEQSISMDLAINTLKFDMVSTQTIVSLTDPLLRACAKVAQGAVLVQLAESVPLLAIKWVKACAGAANQAAARTRVVETTHRIAIFRLPEMMGRWREQYARVNDPRPRGGNHAVCRTPQQAGTGE